MPRARLEGVLDINNAPFIKGMNDAVSKAKSSGNAITSAFSGIGSGLAAGLSVAAIAGAARNLGAFASEVHDLADTTNQTTDAFQQYSFAVSQSGGSQEVFVKSMVAISQAMEDAKNGTGKAGEAFVKLGINLDDISNSDPQKILLMIADAMKKSGGSGEAFAAVADLIGVKVATKMVPSLKLGSEGFLELANSADIASKAAIDGAEAAQDRWDKFVVSLKTGALNAFQNVTSTLGHMGAVLDIAAEQDALLAGKTGKGFVPGLTAENNAPSAAAAAMGSSLQDLGVTERAPESAQELVSSLDKGKRAAADMAKEAKETADAFKEQADALREMKSMNLGTVNFNDKAESMRQAAIAAMRSGSAPAAAMNDDSNRAGLNLGGGGRYHLSGSLGLGGKNSAYNQIRHGDAARAKTAAKELADAIAQKEKDKKDPLIAAINKPDWTNPKG